MTKKEFGKGLKERLQATVESAKAAAKEVDLSDVKAKIADTAEFAKTAAKEVDVSEIKAKISDTVDQAKAATKDINAEDVKNKISETVNQAVDGVKDLTAKKKVDDEDRVSEPEFVSIISTKSAIKIIYYLMAADGEIFHSEEEKFDSIGKELDPEFADHKDQIVKECQAQLDKAIDPGDYYDVLQDGVEDALIYSKHTEDSFITPKLLLWDLLTVAYSDESYDDVERKLIKYIVRKTNVDKAVFLEMESSILTLLDVEKELAWIKTTEKPYLTIEAMVNELADRKNVIFESVKDLISL